jgi:hypothetical protein
MTFELSGTPTWVSRALATSHAVDAPRVGELWTLAWDGRFSGTAVIAGAYSDHVLALPVTASAASATEIALHHDDAALALWPQGETGIGNFLLHARIGVMLTDNQVLEVRRWEARLGQLETLQTGSAARTRQQLADVLNHFRELCFIEWPSIAEAVLDIEAVDLEPVDFARETGLSTPTVLALWDGVPPTAGVREVIEARNDGWLTIRSDEAIASLSSPAVKDLFIELTALMGGDERAARNAARREYSLAARTSSVIARDTTRAADTVRQLIEETRASLG